MISKLTIFLASFFLAVHSNLIAQDDLITFFPNTNSMSLIDSVLEFTNQLEVTASKDFEKNNEFVTYQAGTQIPLIKVQADPESYLAAGLLGFIRSEFDMFSDSFNLLGTDFQIGFSTTFKNSDIAIDAILYHVSSHAGDDFLRLNGIRKYENIGWEAIRLGIGYDACEVFKPYVKGEIKYAKRPIDKIKDKGFVLAGVSLLFKDLLNLKIITEAELQIPNWYINFGTRAELPLAQGIVKHFAFIQWNIGQSKQGVFYDSFENRLSIGMGLSL